MSDSVGDVAHDAIAHAQEAIDLYKEAHAENMTLRARLEQSIRRQIMFLEAMQAMHDALMNEPIYEGPMPPELLDVLDRLRDKGEESFAEALRIMVRNFRDDVLKKFNEIADGLDKEEATTTTDAAPNSGVSPGEGGDRPAEPPADR